MQQQEFEIVNKLGLHARASALFVKTASKFQSEVKLARESVEVNGKSIMGIICLPLQGHKDPSDRDGPDEAEAMETIGALIIDEFGEDITMPRSVHGGVVFLSEGDRLISECLNLPLPHDPVYCQPRFPLNLLWRAVRWFDNIRSQLLLLRGAAGGAAAFSIRYRW